VGRCGAGKEKLNDFSLRARIFLWRPRLQASSLYLLAFGLGLLSIAPQVAEWADAVTAEAARARNPASFFIWPVWLMVTCLGEYSGRGAGYLGGAEAELPRNGGIAVQVDACPPGNLQYSGRGRGISR